MAKIIISIISAVVIITAGIVAIIAVKKKEK